MREQTIFSVKTNCKLIVEYDRMLNLMKSVKHYLIDCCFQPLPRHVVWETLTGGTLSFVFTRRIPRNHSPVKLSPMYNMLSLVILV